MRRKTHCKLMMDHCIMSRTDGKVGLAWEPVISMVMRARMATMELRRKKHRKPMMDQHRMWRTEGIVLESVKIGQYTSDL